MATVKISQLTNLVGPPDSDDFIAIVDASVSETKRISVTDFLSGIATVDSVANATFAIQATTADSANGASFALLANRALTADSVAVAASALTADAADSAVNATNAILAQRAYSADSATNATNATLAQRAEKADSATTAAFALRADYLTLDSVATATRALTADSATRSGTAIFSDRAGFAEYNSQDSATIWGIGADVPRTADSAIDSLKTSINAITISDSADIISLLSTGVQSILPAADSTYDLGSPTRKWKDLYLSGSTIYLGDSAVIFAQGTTLNIPRLTVTETFNGTFEGSGADSAWVLSQIPNVLDSADVVSITGGLSGLDSNGVRALVDSAYVQLRQSPGGGGAGGLDSALVSQLVDSAYVQLRQSSVGSGGLDSALVTQLIDSAYVQLRETPQDFAYSSLTGAPNVLDSADVASISGSISGLDSNGVRTLVDSAYVQARQSSVGSGGLDSALVTQLIDSAYVQLRETAQDFAYSSLTGTPNVLDSADVALIAGGLTGLDSTGVISLVDSAYVQLRQTAQDFAYSSLTGAPNVLDSANVITLISANETPQDFAYSSLTGAPNVLDSSDVALIAGGLTGLDSTGVISLVDSAYVQLRETAQDFAYSSLTGTPNILDSANVITLIGANQDFAYSSLTGAPNVLDSANVITLINNNATGLDSAAVLAIPETVYSLTGTDIDPANGGIQTKTFTTNTTFTESLASGESVVLMLNSGASYTITWPTITWVTSSGNVTPTLTANDAFVLWKVSSTLYGAYVGSYA